MKKLFKLFLVCVFLSIVVNFFYRNNILEFRSSFVFDILRPISVVFSGPAVLPNKDNEQIRVLKNEVQGLKREILRLKKELQTREDFTHEYIEARNIFFENDRIQINQGTRAGVFENKQVIVGNNLVGNVILVEKHRSLVGLLNNAQVKNLCFARHNSSDVWGLLTGQNGERVILTKITQEKKIDVGDKVYCENFYAGTVSKIIKESSELFYTAEVKPAVNAENLDTVYVVGD